MPMNCVYQKDFPRINISGPLNTEEENQPTKQILNLPYHQLISCNLNNLTGLRSTLKTLTEMKMWDKIGTNLHVVMILPSMTDFW